MTLKLPRLAANIGITDTTGKALTIFTRLWNTAMGAIENQFLLSTTPGVMVSLDSTNGISRVLQAGTGLAVINGDGQSGNPQYSLAASGATAGTYGDATHVGAVTVNAQGQVTGASDVAINVLTIIGYTPANKAGDTFTGTVDVSAGVKLGAFSTSADAPVTGYITVMDSSGTSHKLAVIS